MKKIYPLLSLLAIISFSSFAQLEYKDVAPIFYNRCASCHHPNGGAPFSLMSYSETYLWKASINTDLQSGKMPPWMLDTTYSRFTHERIITLSEKTDILNWLSAGAPAGDTALAPAPPVFSQYKLHGTPDLILKIPTFTSNAGSADSYVCFSLPTGFSQDRILRAYEIVPGNPAIVHHVVVMVDTTNSTSNNLTGNCFYPPGDFGVGGYAPGAAPTVFPGEAPLKAGIRIPDSSRIVLQIHYPVGTGGQVDSTQIRLFFYPLGTTGVREVFAETPLQNWTLYIPAGTTKTYTAQSTDTSTLSIFAAFPHSHKVCTKILNYAFSGTDTIRLVRTAQWNFEWQGYYTYKNLLKVPAGYTFFSSHFYDNTTANPFNPHNPPQLVTAGQNTTDEMLFDGFQWLIYQPGDETIDIESILANDTLLTANHQDNHLFTEGISSFAYPNPFDEKIRIGYDISSSSNVSISIYNIYGSTVKIFSTRFETQGARSVEWDGKNNSGNVLPGGVYFYTISAGKSVSSGKVVLLPKR